MILTFYIFRSLDLIRMAQAIPITHQQKIVRPAATGRWSSSSTSQQQPVQQQPQQQSSSEMAENLPVYQTSIYLNSTLPATVSSSPSTSVSSASFDRNRVASATIPRQQKQNQFISIISSPSDGEKSNFSQDQQRFSAYHSSQSSENSVNSVGRRRSSYETAQINVQQKNNFNRETSAPVAEPSVANISASFMDEESANNLAGQFQNLSMSTPPATAQAKILPTDIGTPSTNATTMVILNADSVIATTAEEDGSTTVTISGIGGTVRSSPMSDSKWTSFDDSEGDGDEASSR